MATLRAFVTDITTLDVDAIVNAANESLAPGGGVCGAIHAAAGPELAAFCASIGGCPTGHARLTPGFALPAKFVIHAVGPVWRGGSHGEAERLASAYRSALQIAEQNGCTSVAFPAISTGIFGYPLDEATAIAVRTAREATAATTFVQEVVFACFSAEALASYCRAGVEG